MVALLSVGTLPLKFKDVNKCPCINYPIGAATEKLQFSTMTNFKQHLFTVEYFCIDF